jgi:hypothetical protein
MYKRIPVLNDKIQQATSGQLPVLSKKNQEIL